MVSTSGCGAIELGVPMCGRPAEVGSPLNLCSVHLLAAYDWVARDVGATDLLPSPCAACGSSLGVRYPAGWQCAICEWRVGDIPDGDEVPARVDVVYYLRFGDRIKIGTSANPHARLAQLRYDELLAFERGGRATEQRRHAQFATHRFPGSEWFVAHAALTEHILAISAGVEDPWDSYKRWMSAQVALRS